MTIEFLVNWLDEHLPEGSEARGQLQTEDAVDVWSVLPTFTSRFQVRVQVFTHAETVLASDLAGPEVDQDGNQTPVLRLYWRSGHFVPVFESAGPVARLPVRRPLGGAAGTASGGAGALADERLEWWHEGERNGPANPTCLLVRSASG